MPLIMSIFSRKSKPSQPQPVSSDKQNGQADPRRDKSRPGTSSASTYTTDPIVQRMAVQAASRRRMNSETPDYSIQSASPNRNTPRRSRKEPEPLQADYEKRKRHAGQNDDTRRKTMDTASNAFPLEATAARKHHREPSNHGRKSCTNLYSLTTPMYSDVTDFGAQTKRVPPKERGEQVSRDSGYASVARTSTTDSPTQSETSAPQEPELLQRHRKINALLPNNEDPSKERTFSLPASRTLWTETKPRDVPAPRSSFAKERRDSSSTYVSRLDPGANTHSFLSSSVVSETARLRVAEASLEPFARSGFENTESGTAKTQPNPNANAQPKFTERRTSESNWRPKESEDLLSNRSNRCNPQSPQVEVEELPHEPTARAVRLLDQPSRPIHSTELVSPVSPTSVGQSSSSQMQDVQEEGEKVTMKSMEPPQTQAQSEVVSPLVLSREGSQTGTRPVSMLSTLDVRPTEVIYPKPISPNSSAAPHSKPEDTPGEAVASDKSNVAPAADREEAVPSLVSPEEIAASTGISEQPPAAMSDNHEQFHSTQRSEVQADAVESNVRHDTPASVVDTPIPKAASNKEISPTPTRVSADGSRAVQPDEPDARYQSPSETQQPSYSPRMIFPSLGGVPNGDGDGFQAFSVLEGYKINRRGYILDEEGDPIGELVQGDILQCVRRKVNARGEVLDEFGTVVGYARALPRDAAVPAVHQVRDNFRSDCDNESLYRTISPGTSHNRRGSVSTILRQLTYPQQTTAPIEHSMNPSDSKGNTIFLELDASLESQAVPLVDHSEIFVPPFRSAQHRNNSRTLPSSNGVKQRSERVQSDVSHYPSASEGQVLSNAKRVSRPKEPAYGTKRSKSYSQLTNDDPKAVLGPTWESLRGPEGSATQASLRSRVGTGEPREPAALRRTLAEDHNLVGSPATQYPQKSHPRTKSKSSTHQTFATSPLASPAETPASPGRSQQSLYKRPSAPMLATVQPSQVENVSMDRVYANNEDGVPAPTVLRKWTADSTKTNKSGPKRRSLFGIRLGMKEQFITSH